MKTALKTLCLLLPALVPSWRFFDRIAPSPRVEYTVLDNRPDNRPNNRPNNRNDTPSDWREFSPCPVRVSFLQMMMRMVWNPHRNEYLFVTSCAERFIQNPTDHSRDEIMARVKQATAKERLSKGQEEKYIQFRLMFVCRDDGHDDEGAVKPHLAYTSDVEPFGEES